MYTATDTVTLSCATGSEGPEITRTATATSIITQRDADLKALGLARMLAYTALECAFPDGPVPIFYYNVEVTACVDNEPGYVTESFCVTIAAGTIYSTTSQEDADAAAQATAEVRAEQKRDAEQQPVYENNEQSYAGSCSAEYEPYSTSITIPAGTYTSETSQSDADSQALADAQAQVVALLLVNCIQIFYSTVQSYTATCTTPGEVGTPVTVTNSAGTYTSTVSQAAADAASLAAATAAALALIVCTAGYYNTEQSFTASCDGIYGPGWVGQDVTVTIPAGTYHAALQATADSAAYNAAAEQATAGLSCQWTGGVLP